MTRVILFPLSGKRRHLQGGIHALLLGRWEVGRQRALFTSVSQLPLADNSPYATAAFLGVAHCDPLQNHLEA